MDSAMTAKYDEPSCVDAGEGTIFTHALVTPIPESNARIHHRSSASLLTIELRPPAELRVGRVPHMIGISVVRAEQVFQLVCQMCLQVSLD
jgi:hypothetical protein